MDSLNPVASRRRLMSATSADIQRCPRNHGYIGLGIASCHIRVRARMAWRLADLFGVVPICFSRGYRDGPQC